MNKAICITPLLLSAMTTQPSAAQVKKPFGDEVGTLDGIMKAYYDVVSVIKGVLPSHCHPRLPLEGDSPLYDRVLFSRHNSLPTGGVRLAVKWQGGV